MTDSSWLYLVWLAGSWVPLEGVGVLEVWGRGVVEAEGRGVVEGVSVGVSLEGVLDLELAFACC